MQSSSEETLIVASSYQQPLKEEFVLLTNNIKVDFLMRLFPQAKLDLNSVLLGYLPQKPSIQQLGDSYNGIFKKPFLKRKKQPILQLLRSQNLNQHNRQRLRKPNIFQF